MFAFQDRRGAVEVAFTDRHGAIGGGRSGSLDLAESDGDGGVTEENIRRVTGTLAGTSPGTHPIVARMHQVHGAQVEVTGGSDLRMPIPECDGLVTGEAGVMLMVRVADCAPVLLADVEQGVIGAAHAGRHGMVAGIVPATVKRMRELGARQIVGWVGPRVCGGCYEVPDSMRKEVAAAVPQAYSETTWGTPGLDIGAGIRAQLEADDVETIDVPRCTIEDEDLFSFRREGPASGRLAGLVWVQP